MAQKVVQALLDSLVEKTMGSSREDTLYAQKFLVKQISDYEERLTKAEQRLAEFKKQNVGLMPSQGGGYYQRLQTSLDELEDSNSALTIAQNRRSELQKQLKGERDVIGNTELDNRINEKLEELNELLLRYTDRHPDVLALRQTIAQLKRQKKADSIDRRSLSGEEAELNPVYQSIKIAMSEVDVEIATLQTRVEGQKREIEELRKLVDTMPEVEANLARLNRDYDVTKAQYEALLERLESARLSEGAELSKDEIKFRVIEPPILPVWPSEPNRFILLSMVLLAGLGAGLGFAYLLNEIKPVFCTAEELNQTTGLPVLGVVSIKLDEERMHLTRVNIKYLAGGIAALFFVYLIVLVLV
jgi:polysaccharide chain length determinant protein (PEP-CTERM system associated)